MTNIIKSMTAGEGTPFEADLVVLDDFGGYVDFKDKRFNSSKGLLPWFTGQMEDADGAEARVLRHYNDLKLLMETVLHLLSISAS